jgi:serine protease SohB
VEFISVYGLFLAKVATVVLAIAALAILAVSLGQRKSRQKGELQLTDLGEQYREMQRDMRLARMDAAEQKVWLKQFKKQTKSDDKLKKQPSRACMCWISKAAWTRTR